MPYVHHKQCDIDSMLDIFQGKGSSRSAPTPGKRSNPARGRPRGPVISDDEEDEDDD